VVPAVALAVLLGSTWRAMHAPTVMQWQPEATADATVSAAAGVRP
jgi:hypothetical protein